MTSERSTTSHLIVFIPQRLPSTNDILKKFHHNGVLIENMERPIHFRRFKEETRKWVEVSKISCERHGHLVYIGLQGLAHDTIHKWLTSAGKEARRKERLRKGNRKYRIKEWEKKLQKKLEEAQLSKLAD